MVASRTSHNTSSRQSSSSSTKSQQHDTLYVGNLPTELPKHLLVELFYHVGGPIDELNWPTDRASGRPKNHAFVHFKHPESVEYVPRVLEGLFLYGRKIVMRPA